ncbi:UPF0149 family protein [Parendozoicomonas haliclonae]|uniref:YecA family protein n=1 Tax=Parendozoicomonas haliclonae TaxID=1960125 RepID=A0A1X7AGS4_9GAMM|nr:UPF0149 family protein [Parendozoicomonas haliclonae]SMA38946.1 hypothetical protein EHSB41UT_00948 [Parendozoicomonas haliclonae]
MKDTDSTDSSQGVGFSFDRLGDLFVEARSFTSPSQLHGLLCGQLCAGLRPSQKSWLDAAASQMSCAEELPVNVRSGLVDLYDVVLADLDSEDLSFKPMLPEADTTVGQRAEALGQWCSGFISGFGMAGIARDKLSEEASGVITDLAQISLVSTDELEESEESEKDFFEVCEYVRMAALMLFNEFQDSQDKKEQQEQHSVH